MTYAQRAAMVTPGGAQTRSKRPSAFPWPAITLVNGRGARVTDTDGREYIDWICGLGAIGLGYAFEPVEVAVRRQTYAGVSFSLPTRLEVEVAEQIVELGEAVRFVKTGSEATEGAMRIARLATGRDVVIHIGYHGWHSVHDAAVPSHPGVPSGYSRFNIGVGYNDLTGLENVLSSTVAAVIMEPARDEAPQLGYLERVRDLCTAHGALLIFDEMVTGFRWAIAGGQEFFSVKPDLSCYGKALANGYPLAVIVGSRELMEHASYVSGTFGGECIALAACSETLHQYRVAGVIEHMWRIGGELMREFNKLDADLKLVGYAVHPRLVGSEARRLPFLADLAAKGVLWHPKGFNVSLSHGKQEMGETLEACCQCLRGLS